MRLWQGVQEVVFFSTKEANLMQNQAFLNVELVVNAESGVLKTVSELLKEINLLNA